MKSARVTMLLNLCLAIAASCVLIILADYAQEHQVLDNVDLSWSISQAHVTRSGFKSSHFHLDRMGW